MTTPDEVRFGKEIIRFGTWIVTEQGLLAEKPHYFIDKTDYFKDIQPSDRTAVSVWKTLKFQHSEFERRRRNRDQEELRQSD